MSHAPWMNTLDSIDLSQKFFREIQTSRDSYVETKHLLLDLPLWEKADTD